ncbi:SGNH/GDSL hydrolase family protein [Listeria costaricensis]|uniref:SGNH/GDSL hydrolase family protein n=1 Tax=Listeria costaricensis TaxID=2026604 RepID=UPI000C07BCEC|nr:SGNH/GDSL hydrolase family protein [Listeria costaricensis]
MKIKADSRILFQGDSVTDAGRDRSKADHLGEGYVSMIAEKWDGPGTLLNRGISGNTSADMAKRWQEDTIDLQPDVVTILIGINDTWRSFDTWQDTSTSAFKAVYEQVLRETRDKTEAQIILMEPFVLPWPEDRKEWRSDLDPKIQVVRELAAAYKTGFIPLDGLMNQAGIQYGAETIAADGVHPTAAGHALIADIWLDYFHQ